MSNLRNALTSVKKGLEFEESNNQLEMAILEYEKALKSFQKAASLNELKNQTFQNELKEQLSFYSQKVMTLKSKLKVQSPKVTRVEEDCDLVERIKSTVVIEKPTTRFENVAGLEDVKHSLEQAVVLPIKHPELFSDNFTPYKGFLLFGPPGTGKTHLARAVAGEASGTTFFSLSASDLLSKYQGESENLVKSLFKLARRQKPSIIFIDEVDSLAMARSDSEHEGSRRIKTELFVQMQGANTNNSGVFVMAATNTPHNLDEAFLRRFDKLLYIPLPDQLSRHQLFKMEFLNFVGLSNEDLLDAAAKSDGLSGSDIEILARKVKMETIKRLERSTHFRKSNKEGKVFWTPCNSTAWDAIPMTLNDVPPNSLDFVQELRKADLSQCVKQAKPRTDISTIRLLEKFAEEKADWVKPLPVSVPKGKSSKARTIFGLLISLLD